MENQSEIKELAIIMGLRSDVAERVKRSYYARARRIIKAGYVRHPQQQGLVPLSMDELIKTLEHMPCICHTNYEGDRKIIADFICAKFGAEAKKEETYSALEVYEHGKKPYLTNITKIEKPSSVSQAELQNILNPIVLNIPTDNMIYKVGLVRDIITAILPYCNKPLPTEEQLTEYIEDYGTINGRSFSQEFNTKELSKAILKRINEQRI